MARQFIKNFTPPRNAGVILQLKDFLVANGATVLASSDGVSTFGAGDRLTTSTTGPGGLGNPRAWFVLNWGDRQLCFRADPNGGTGYYGKYWWIGYSMGALFANNGTLTIPPTAPDLVSILGYRNVGEEPTNAALIAAEDGLGRFQMMADPETYAFYSVGWIAATTTTIHALMMDPLAPGSYPAQEPDPFMFFADGGTMGNIMIAATSLSYTQDAHPPSTANAPKGWLGRGTPSEGWAAIPGCSPGNGRFAFPGCGANPFTGKEELIPSLYARTNRASAGPIGFKGMSSLVSWVSSDRASGDTLTVATTNDRLVFGSVSLPWDGSVPTL